ncbi:MAG: Ig-like domain-containing protein [Burkholderiales bacterium]|nr:Ig-like domain-containing protein [Burkholderiales bacterium]
MAANWTLTQVLNQLNGGSKWSGDTITYAFPSTANGLFSQGEAAGFRAVNDSQRAWMTLALATWDELMPQTFTPGTPGSTNIEFGYTSTGIGFAHAYYPTIGSAWFNATEDTLVATAIGQYGFQTFIHEIGHALGLDHMGDYNGNGNWAPSSYQDSVVLSIMSYFGPRYAAPNYSAEVMQADWVAADGQTYSPQTPMLNDIMAIQAIYGASTSTRLDNTVYGFSSTIGGTTAPIYDFTQNAHPILTLYDAGGTDTLDLSGWSTPSRIDLHAGAFSSANSMTNNIAIAYNTTIENARGGAGADVITGNDVANRLEGGGGNDELYGSAGDDTLVGGTGDDLLDGGDGTDTALLDGSFGSYTISVAGNRVTLRGSTGGTDTTTAVERFQFTDGVRTLGELAPGSDSTAPVLQSLSPADNAGNAAVSANLVLGFNEAVKAGAGSISIFNAEGTLVRSIAAGDTSQVRITGGTVTIDPAANLPAGRSFYVTVDASAFTDLSNNAYAGFASTTAWNFSTASSDTEAPRVVSLTPADDSASVAVGANLVLGFDEAVVAGTGNITLRAGNQVVQTLAITDTARVTISGSTVTINPSADLAPSTAYSVTVDAGALRDAAGNAFAGLLGSTGWNFSTAGAGTTDDYSFDTGTTGVVNVNGTAASGSLEVAGDADLFKVQLVQGTTYTFTLQRTAGGLADPYLALYAPNLNLVAEDDDSAGAGNARIGYTAPTTGTYYLAAFDYNDTGTGAYTLGATTQDTQAPTLQTRTPADDTTQVNVAADLTLVFSEAVRAGSGSIRLLNSTGQVLRDIRAGDALVSIDGNTVRINPGANLPSDTAIIVRIDADAFRDGAGNAFAGISDNTSWNFRTAPAAATDDFPLDVNTSGVVLPNGPAVAARIDSPNDGDLFKVTLAAGVTYRFDMIAPQSNNLDPFLVLYGTLPEVGLITYDDDSGPLPLDAQLYFTPSASGTYYLAAYDYSEGTGSYTLSSVVPSDDYLGATASSGRITVGGAATTGVIGVPSDIDVFGIAMTAGRQYTIDLKSNKQSAAPLDDAYMVLLDASGKALAYDDDSGVGLDAEITFTAPTTGMYYVAASDFDIAVGSYTVSAFVRTVIPGTGGADKLAGTTGPDTLDGGNGSDQLTGGRGDDILQGGASIDFGLFGGFIGDYTIRPVQGGWELDHVHGTDGRDLLYGVERLAFQDLYLALDMDGHAGSVVKLLGALLGVRFDAPSNELDSLVGIGLELLDGGMSEAALMQAALTAVLGQNPSNAAVVNLLYSNLVGTLPTPAERASLESLITSGQYTQVTLALAAANTELNAANIDLAGLADYGVTYA